jgi:serine/threonine protein kinase
MRPVQSIESILAAAVELSSETERRQFLDNACAEDAELRNRVDQLIENHFRAGSFLESSPALAALPKGEGFLTTVDGPITEAPGTVIGPYKLLEQIGEGGFGLVFMAEQQQPVRRKVAVKVIKPGMDSRHVIARFEAERQALALMDHPNIARVLEAGETSANRPYFAMELVRGVPITEYCDQNGLSTRSRLELFVTVCQAVQHAHQKGIIHRDIKPSNVLVTLHDGAPLVKVIDFGIAKALGQQLTDKTVFTAFAQMIGTPLYMAPEQAAMSHGDVDTRTDIYSLGVLLYELLTGTTPFDAERLRRAGYDEIRRIIQEEEPARPSTRVSTMGQAATVVSARRQSDPKGLSQLFRGELDWIVMQAMEKDRNRRYETASALAADVTRYLNDEPVAACPPSARYRLGKFVRRNRGPVLAASLVLLALVFGVVGTSLGLLQAKHAAEAERQAKETAQQRLTQHEKANEILGSIFKDLNPEAAERQNKPLQALLGERLEQASAQLEGDVIGDPLAVARMQVILGQSQLGLGHLQKAILLFTKARTTFGAQLGPEHPDTLRCAIRLAAGYGAAGNLDLALPLQEETFRLLKATLGPDDPDTLASMNHLAWDYQSVGNLQIAVPLFEEVLQRRKAKNGTDDLDTLQSMNNLALAYHTSDKLDLALPLFEEVLNRRKAQLGPEDLDTLESMSNLALGYLAVGKVDRALPLYQETFERTKAKLGPDHPYTLIAINNQAGGYLAIGKPALALPLFQRVLQQRKAKLGFDHPDTLQSMNNLALAYQDANKLDLALPLYVETLERRKATFGPVHPYTLQSMNNLAWGYLAAGKLDLALPLYEETLKVNKQKFGVDHPTTLRVMTNLGMGYIRVGQSTKAEPLLRECLEVCEKKWPEAWITFHTKSMLGAALLDQKKYSEAEPLLLTGYQGIKERGAQITKPYKIRKKDD